MEFKNFKGLKIPVIGFGTYTLDKKAVKEAVEVGYRHLDTARNYGNEADVGEAWSQSKIRREDFFITTKIWHDSLRPAQVKQEIEKSLQLLKTDYVDLLLIHWPSTENVPLEDTLEAFERVKEEGKTRAIGISNFTAEMQKKAMQLADIHCNQVEYHPYLNQEPLVKLCEENNVALTAYRPIAKTKITEEVIIKDIAGKYKKSPVQVVLRWLIQQKPVVAIPRSSNKEHMSSNMNIFDFNLSIDEITAIHTLEKGLRQINPAFGPW